MIRIAYISKVASDFGDTELENILRASRFRNRCDDITGILMYHGEAVLQILEGSEEKVRSCYNRIKVDPRHSCIEGVDERTITKRAFSDWSMGLVRPEKFDTLPGTSLHSFREISERLKGAKLQDLPVNSRHLISTMSRFVDRISLRELT